VDLARTPIALAAGLTLTAAALAVTLSHSPLGIARTSVASAEYQVMGVFAQTSICQASETLPQGTSAVRIAMSALTLGPKVYFRATSAAGVLTDGSRQAGWRGGSVTVPVQQVSRTATGARVCIATGPISESVGLSGEQGSGPTMASSGGRRLGGRVKVEYLRPDRGSWWSLLAPVAKRMGFGRVPGGAWAALLVWAGMTSLTVLASWLVVRPDRERR
jgi:hypothetical protein